MSKDRTSKQPPPPNVSPIDDTSGTSRIQLETQSQPPINIDEHEQRAISSNANSRSAEGNNGADSFAPLTDLPEPERPTPANNEHQELSAEVTAAPHEITVHVQRTTNGHVPDADNTNSTTHPPPEATPRPSNPVYKHSFFGLIHAWILELFACLLAATIVVIEVVLLSYYANESYRTWNHQWAINSVFAFLTAILEAAVAFSVGSCMGQLRWLWYQKDDSALKWMDRLTNARSPPGAIRFVFSHRAYRRTAFLGALLIVSLLGVGVFTQNVITIRGALRELDSNTSPASAPITNTYYGQWQFGSTGLTPGDQVPYIEIMAAIDAGFTFPASVEEKDNILDLVTCSTGNCTFGQYSTLALCTKCADITETIVCGDGKCERPYRLSLQNDTLSLDPVTGYLNITSDTSYPSSETLSGIGPLIVRYLGLGFTRAFSQGGRPNATECALYWCVNTYNASASAFEFNEEMTETWTNLTSSTTQYGQDTRIHLRPEHCYINGSQSTSDSGSCGFGVDPLSQRALQNYLVYGSRYANTSGFLTGSVSLTTGATTNNHWLVDGLAANAVMSPYYVETNETEAVYSLFGRCLESMANYISKAIRKVADTGPGFSYGTTSNYTTYFHVRWGWLAYPILVVILAFVFLIITIVKSRHTEPWKSSVTALLFHGLTDEDKNANLHLDDPEEMRMATEDWIVRLQDEGGVRSFRKKGSTAWTLHVPEEAPTGVAQVGMAVLKAVENTDIL